MNILFTISHAGARGGTEAAAFILLHQFKEYGINAKLFSIVPYEGADEDVVSLPNKEYERYRRINRSVVNKVLGNALAKRFLRRKIQKVVDDNAIGVIVNHTLDIADAIPRGKGIKCVQILHWSILGYRSALLKGYKSKNNTFRTFIYTYRIWMFFRRIYSALRRYSCILTLTESAQSELPKVLGGVEGVMMRSIPNSLPVDSDSKVISTLKNRRVVFAGRLSREKGCERLLSIWKMIAARKCDCELLIYGDGDMRQEMEGRVQKEGLRNVHFKGYVAEKSVIFADSDIYLNMSDTEGFGLTFIEAMYYGVPAISFDCPTAPRDVLGDAGVLIGCFDETAYANKVIELMDNYELLKEYQGRAIRRARKYYQSSVMRKWRGLLQELDPGRCMRPANMEDENLCARHMAVCEKREFTK